MTRTANRNFLATLTTRINKAGQSAHLVLGPASEIVVFGSRAAGVQRADSDLDVLCVGVGLKLKTSKLDLIWVSEELVLTQCWLGSELASHIAEYGVPIRGNASWRSRVKLENQAIDRKLRRIASLLQSASAGWEKLHPLFRKRYQTTIRREIQRYALLRQHVSVPPTPVLDCDWHKNKARVLEVVPTMGLKDQTSVAIEILTAPRQLLLRPLRSGHPSV